LCVECAFALRPVSRRSVTARKLAQSVARKLLPDGKVDGVALALQRVEEVTVAEDFRVSIPEKVRRRLGIKAGDRLRVRVERGAIILEPVKPREALERLASIADRLLGGPQRVDAVKLIERSLKREAGLH